MESNSNFAKILKACALSGSLLFVVFVLLYLFIQNNVFLALAITAGTTAYHFVMRLAVGWIIPLLTRSRINPNGFWFRQRSFEQKLYQTLRIRRWKGKMPTYRPEDFALDKNTPEQIIQNSCTAELVHEVIILASFLPLIAAHFWGELPVFITTSLFAAGLDSCFVMMQRYNRPRFQNYLKRNQTTTRRLWS